MHDVYAGKETDLIIASMVSQPEKKDIYLSGKLNQDIVTKTTDNHINKLISQNGQIPKWIHSDCFGIHLGYGSQEEEEKKETEGYK